MHAGGLGRIKLWTEPVTERDRSFPLSMELSISRLFLWSGVSCATFALLNELSLRTPPRQLSSLPLLSGSSEYRSTPTSHRYAR